jgi:DNA-binding response OmpR family regulator
MSELFLLTNAAEPPPEILPALGLLLHTVRTGPADMIALDDAAGADVILVDARRDLIPARRLCQLMRRAAPEAPVVAIMTEGGLAAVTAEWGIDDVVLHSAGPAEVEARLRLAAGRQVTMTTAAPDEIRSGDLAIDEATYTARLRARTLDLTFKEFELLKFLAQHPGRVFTRAHLLQEVWGYDYFGGTRTVDVHVRRLRAKLGPEYEALIGTVRNVGYRFVPLKVSEDARRGHQRDGAPTGTGSAPTGTGSAPTGTGTPRDQETSEPEAGQPGDGHPGDSHDSKDGNGTAPPREPGGHTGNSERTVDKEGREAQSRALRGARRVGTARTER